MCFKSEWCWNITTVINFLSLFPLYTHHTPFNQSVWELNTQTHTQPPHPSPTSTTLHSLHLLSHSLFQIQNLFFSHSHFSFNSPFSTPKTNLILKSPPFPFLLSLFTLFYSSPLAALVIIVTRLVFSAGSLLNSLDQLLLLRDL